MVMRIKFHICGYPTSYREKSSISSPTSSRRGRRGGPALSQKLFNFRTLRGGEGAAKAGAFQRCGGGSESERLVQLLTFGDRQRKGAVEDVAGAQGIHGVDREGRRFFQ